MWRTPGDLNFFCDLTSCDLLDALVPEFAAFQDLQKGVGGLVNERCAVLGTLDGNQVDGRGRCLGTQQKIARRTGTKISLLVTS